MVFVGLHVCFRFIAVHRLSFLAISCISRVVSRGRRGVCLEYRGRYKKGGRAGLVKMVGGGMWNMVWMGITLTSLFTWSCLGHDQVTHRDVNLDTIDRFEYCLVNLCPIIDLYNHNSNINNTHLPHLPPLN